MRRLNKYDGIKTIEEYKTYYEDTSKEEILNDTYIDFINYVQLQNNWNDLKDYLKRFDLEYLRETCEHNLADTIEVLLDKMQEIESRKQ